MDFFITDEESNKLFAELETIKENIKVKEEIIKQLEDNLSIKKTELTNTKQELTRTNQQLTNEKATNQTYESRKKQVLFIGLIGLALIIYLAWPLPKENTKKAENPTWI